MGPDEKKMKHRPTASDVYAAVAARRLHSDVLTWQVPVVALAAQAFLLTVGLDSGQTRVARGVVLALGVLVIAWAGRLMVRYRMSEMNDSQWLEKWDEQIGILEANGESWARKRAETDPKLGVLRLLGHGRAIVSTLALLGLFGIADAGFLVLLVRGAIT